MLNIPQDARWSQNGVTFAGGNGDGGDTSQLDCPYSIAMDDDETMIIADFENHRILQWKKGHKNGKVIAGINSNVNISILFILHLLFWLKNLKDRELLQKIENSRNMD